MDWNSVMMTVTASLFFALIASKFGRIYSQDLGADCSVTTSCTDTTNHVCETTDGSHVCKVKADGAKTNCLGVTANCPFDATCNGTTCTCDNGYIELATGLCTVQDADCSGTICGNTYKYVCDTAASDKCKVKADGAKTDCLNENANCASHATCSTTTCSCDSGYIAASSGLCTVQGADCSGGTVCGNTTNYVCDTAAGDTCKVKADGAKTDCLSLTANCATHATCGGTTCTCDDGYTVLGTGLCTAIIGINCANSGDCTALDPNTECSAGTGLCACVSGYKGSAGETCTVQDADCSGETTCGDTTNYVCDTAAGDTCKLKADGTATDCSSTDSNCPTNAACNTTTCGCNSGYTEAAGLCEAIIGNSCANNGECSALDANSLCGGSSQCTCVSGYIGSAGDTCTVSSRSNEKTTVNGIILLTCIILLSILF